MSTFPVPPACCARRVLVIEDHRDSADSMVMLLELLGHKAEAAFNGPAGLAAARRAAPDIVLCDVGLPGGMDGYQVAGLLKAEVPGALLVAVTGYGRDEDVKRAGAAGFDRHLTKPITLEQLRGVLEKS